MLGKMEGTLRRLDQTNDADSSNSTTSRTTPTDTKFDVEGSKPLLNLNGPNEHNKGHKSLTRSSSNIWSHNKMMYPMRMWLKYSVWTALAFILMIAFGSGSWAYPDGGSPSCIVNGVGADKNKLVCGVKDVLIIGSQSIRVLTSFILGGFILSTRKLWLTRRSAYCALCGSTRNLLINVTSLAPAHSHKLLARWAVLGYELSVLKARGLIDTNEGKHYLQISKLLSDGEWEAMVDGDRHTTVWYWIMSRSKRLKESGQIDAFELQTICNAVTLSRDKANDLMSPIDRDQPPPYVFVCSMLVNIFLLLWSSGRGFVWSTWMNDAGGWAVFKEPRIYLDMIVMYLCTTLFAMLFDICASLYNPFGPRGFDIRHDIVSKGLRHLAVSLSSGSSVPDTIGALIDEGLEGPSSSIFLADESRVSSAERHLTRRVHGFNSRNTLLPSLSSRFRIGAGDRGSF